MPTPVYVICAENVVIDQRTNLATIVNALEKVECRTGPSSGKPAKHTKKGAQSHDAAQVAFPFKSIAVWRRDRSDADNDQIEVEHIMVSPSRKRVAITRNQFSFGEGKQLYRLMVHYQTIPVDLRKSGKLILEVRARKLGTRQWITQSYIIDVVFIEQGE